MRIKITDKKILKTFSIVVAFISSVIGILAVAIDYDKKYAWVWFVTWAFLLILLYLLLFIIANIKRSAHFKINGTKVNVFVGDIFEQKDGLIVIPANEYFDTKVDDKIVSKTSLHGRYLLNYCKDINDLETTIKRELTPIDNNERNVAGHNSKYELGSLIEKDGFILTAFTRFDDNNKAFLHGKDYLYFWGSFWSNVDTIFAGRSIYIPLVGAGITRFKDYQPTKQELLENILLTMKNSGFRNNYSSKSVNIVVYKGDASEIDFYHLNERIGN